MNELLELEQKMLACEACDLFRTRTKVVFGSGPTSPKVMVIGESPGEEEDLAGQPFIGKAGKKLDGMLAYAGLKREDVYITNSVLCLYPNTLVYLPDGSSKRISQLAAEEYRGPVLSFDEKTKTFVEKNVTAIHRNKLNGRKWLKVTYRGAKKNVSGVAGAIVTEDHEFLTDNGWISARDIMAHQGQRECCDISINVGPEAFNDVAYNIALGTLLGDGTIGKSAALEFSHAHDQKEWAILKSRVFGCKPKFQSATINNIQNQWRVRIPAIRCVSYFRDEFYKNGKKQVPHWIADAMTPLMLATWFCDDGYTKVRKNHGGPLAEIATCSFNDESIEILISGIHKLGINAYKRKSGNKKQYNRIKFNVKETEKLLKLIAPYVPKCLAYKVPGQTLQGTLVKQIFIEQPKEALYSEAIVSEAPKWTYKNQTTYCLSVEETENFVTPGGVVHNCHPPLNRNPNRQELNACKWRLDLQIKLLKPELIIVLGKVAAEQIKGEPIKGPLNQFFPENTNIKWISYKNHNHECKMLISYHPSFILRCPDKGYQAVLPHWTQIKEWVANGS